MRVSWVTRLAVAFMCITVCVALDQIPAQKNLLVKQIERTQKALIRMQRQKRDEAEASEYGKLVDDLVKQASKETNSTLRQKQLQMANEIIRNPLDAMRSLKKRLTLKTRAKSALDKAKAEKDPKLQAKFLEEAESLIIEFKTGRRPPKKVSVDKEKLKEEEELVTIDEVEGRFGEELVLFSEKIAGRLLKKAKETRDASLRNATMDTARGILSHPKESLREFVRREDIIRQAKKLAFEMTRMIKKESDSTRKVELIKRRRVLLKDPVGFHDRIVKEEESKIIKNAVTTAKKIMEQAEKEKEFKTAKEKMDLAKLYFEHPLNVWANLTRFEAIDKLMTESPPECRAYVDRVYHLGNNSLVQVFGDITRSLPPPPVTGIVNLAQVMTEKKSKIVDEFDVEKNFIKISFTGWMKRNSEPEEEVKPHGKVAQKAKETDLLTGNHTTPAKSIKTSTKTKTVSIKKPPNGKEVTQTTPKTTKAPKLTVITGRKVKPVAGKSKVSTLQTDSAIKTARKTNKVAKTTAQNSTSVVKVQKVSHPTQAKPVKSTPSSSKRTTITKKSGLTSKKAAGQPKKTIKMTKTTKNSKKSNSSEIKPIKK